MENKILVITLFIISLLFNVFVAGLYINKPKEVQVVEESKLVVEMDSSCFEQFKNNIDKTIFVKLNVK